MSSDLLTSLSPFLGKVCEDVVAADPVNAPMVRAWCHALGDDVDRYLGADGVVAPPAMLQAWCKRVATPAAEGQDVRAELLQVCDDAGFVSIVATDCEQRYVRRLNEGDLLRCVVTVADISPLKTTSLGEGHFITFNHDYTDQAGETVAEMTYRVLKFRASESAAPARLPRRGEQLRPAINRDNAFFWEGTQLGEFRIQKCSSCGSLRNPPGPMCPHCRSTQWGWILASGEGTVHSFTVPHYPKVEGLEMPYVVALVDLTEGVRTITNIVDVDPADVQVGMPVELQFDAVDKDLTLPRFHTVPSGTNRA
ncbi:MAG: hypothetical protein JWO98_2123 [Frankiales bacterium]|nr:hypothetical protein [Frankiales bacterium]